MSGRTVTASRGLLRIERPKGADDLKEHLPIAHPRASKGLKYWTAPYTDAETIIEWADERGYEVTPEVKALAEGSWERELRALSLPAVTDLGAYTVTGLTTPLMPVQTAVVVASQQAHILGARDDKRALIVADAPGYGKSIEALASLRVSGNEASRAVVICPSSLTANWLAEVSTHFTADTFHPWVATGETPEPVPDDVDLVIVGWAVISEWSATLTDWGPDAVVVDEGHFAKSGKKRTKKEQKPKRDADNKVVRDAEGNAVMETQTRTVSGSARASGAIEVAKSVRKGLVLALTGTPIVNRPLELLALLEITGIEHLFGGRGGYQMYFCDGKQKKVRAGTGPRAYAWDFSGASNLLELNTRLSTSGHYIRRTKELLVNTGALKKKYVDGVYCYDYAATSRPWRLQLTSAELAEYREAEQETSGFFAEVASDIARKTGRGVQSRYVQRKVAAEGANHLKRISALRSLVAQAKVGRVVEKTSEMVAAGEKVVIAAHHREVVDAYADAFTGLKIQGGMSVQAVEEAKRLFNDTPVEDHPVLVLSVDAGKTGHTLCKQALNGVGLTCAHMIFAEQVWTPGDELQAQDRIWRIGQDREVKIMNVLALGTIDTMIYSLRQKKHHVVNAAVDAIDPEMLKAEAERGMGVLAVGLASGRLG